MTSQVASSGLELAGLDRQVLMFERQWWRFEGSKDQAINEFFGMDSARYYQVLGRLIDTEQALAFDPQLVKRLRCQRLRRQSQRSARRLTAAELASQSR
ncbi:MAG: DUF3263 domain-containing protein [Micrococcales bacterium]|nr:DUF3263 domain-containing protein [Micrococcales bacterium]